MVPERPLATTADEMPSVVPNEAFRRVRKVYVTCVATAIPLLFLALYTTVERIGYGIVPVLLLIAGVCLLIFSMLVRAAAACPRCSASLLWKKGPIGTGRLSLGEKSHCRTCGLDLNAPWRPDPEDPTAPTTSRNEDAKST
ncbi:MAG: hypothetical protein AB7L90_11230 [Hyphomicrobiaceae bacterium]